MLSWSSIPVRAVLSIVIVWLDGTDAAIVVD